jgi:CubicO group peptidase (beta-lactamase class C family)
VSYRIFASRSILSSAVAFVVLSLPVVSVAAGEPSLEGHWEGSIDLPGQKLEIDLDFKMADGAWTGDISIPAQGARDLPLEGISLDGMQATFAITGIPGDPTFSGTISEDLKSIAGDFTQGGATFPFTLTSGADPVAKAAAALAGIDEVIDAALEDWKTPGLGLAVVVDGRVALASGYGLRDVENELPVTENTLFAIGSSSKAFTTLAMGLLADEGELDWDEPVASYLPGFKLYDDYATTHLTPRDMVCHRSGLPRHDLTWYNNEEIARAELVARLAYLEPNEDLRALWQYNNLMFLTAGYLIEVLTGSPWEEAIRNRILDPLGMTRTNFSVHDSQEDADHALPYIEDDDEIRKVDFRPIGVMGPAGSINSSVAEMARWAALHTGGGSIDGEPVISPGTLREMHTPQMIIPGLPQEEHLSPSSYGLGWFIDMWRGHYRVHHGGNIDGFSALVTLFPRDGVGIVVLVNKGGSALPDLITSTVADRVLGLDPRPWIAEAAEERDQAEPLVDAAQEKKDLFRVKNTTPSRDLLAYAGEYEHKGYGVLEIRANGDALAMVYNGMVMPLEHWHFDVFNVAERDDAVIPEDLRANFLTDARGRIARVALPVEPFVDPILFDRLPPRRLSDPAYLGRLAGSYDLLNQSLVATVQGTTLVISVDGGPPLKLVPSGEDEFEIDGITGFTVGFTVPESEPATGMMLITPGGVFDAPRTTAETETD